VVLGQGGMTVQEGSVQFSLVEEDAGGPKFVFESAAGVATEYVHIVDNRLTLHIGANKDQILETSIGAMDSAALGVDDLLVISRDLAEEAISKSDTAINLVSSERAKLGAYVNRLEHTMNVLDIQSENLTAAESRIRDLDMAKETIAFTRNQILMNAGVALLAQANSLPQAVLQLLR
jgi:flagellin